MKTVPFTLLILAIAGVAQSAEPPGILNHQGRIAVGGVNYGSPAPLPGHFKFALVDDVGTILWSNVPDTAPADGEPDDAVTVTVTNGHYALGLGDTAQTNMDDAIPAAIFGDHDEVYLCVWFSTTPGGPFEKLTPQRRLTSTAYALNAVKAGGVSDGAITAVMLAADSVTSDKLSNDAVISTKIAPGAVSGLDRPDGSGTVLQADNAGRVALGTPGEEGSILDPALEALFQLDSIGDQILKTEDFEIQGDRAYVAGTHTTLQGSQGRVRNGLFVFDLSDPIRIEPTGFTECPCVISFNPVSTSVSGGNAFILSDNGGLTAFDLADPDQPVALDSEPVGLLPSDLATEGGFAYVVDGTDDNLVIYDVSNPASITTRGNVSLGNVFGPDVQVQGNFAYVRSFDNLAIFDVTNKDAPDPRDTIAPPTDFFFRSFTVEGNFAYVTGVDNSDFNDQKGVLNIYDVSNPLQITFEGQFDIGLGPSGLSIQVKDGLAYISDDSNDRIAILDVSNPAAVTLQGELYSILAAGGNIIKLGGNTAYIASRGSRCLAAYDISNPAQVPIIGSFGYTLTSGGPIPGCDVEGDRAVVVDDPDRLTLLDLSDPGHIKPLGVIEVPPYSLQAVSLAGNTAFAVGSDRTGDDMHALIAIDLTNPEHLTVRDIEINVDLESATAIEVRDDVAFVAGGDLRFSTWDVSDPDDLQFMDNETTGLGNSFVRSVQLRDDEAFVTDSSLGVLAVFDISDPTTLSPPTTVSSGLSEPVAVALEGDYIYVADRTQGLVTFQNQDSGPRFVRRDTTLDGLAQPIAVVASGSRLLVGDGILSRWVEFDISNPRRPHRLSSTGSLYLSPIGGAIEGDTAFLCNRQFFTSHRFSRKETLAVEGSIRLHGGGILFADGTVQTSAGLVGPISAGNIPRETIDSGHIEDASITFLDIGGSAVRGNHILNGTITAADLGSGAADDADADPTNELQMVSRAGTNVTLSGDGGTVSIADNDNSSSNELQILSLAGTSLTLSNGGGSVSIADNDSSISNELQTLSLAADTLSLSNSGGSANLTQYLRSNTNDTFTSGTLTIGSAATLRIGATDTVDDEIEFDGGVESLRWDDSQSQLEWTDALAIVGTLQTGSTTANAAYNRIGVVSTTHSLNNTSDLLVSDDLEVNGEIFADGGLEVTGSVGIGVTPAGADLHIRNATTPTIKMESNGNSVESGRLSLRQPNGSGVDLYYDGITAVDGLVIEPFDAGAAAGPALYVGNRSTNRGRVGIGTTDPSHLLHVDGVARSTSASWATSSDARAKENVQQLEGSLERLAKLRPVRFEYGAAYRNGRDGYDGTFTGFIAQEIEQVFPEMVSTVSEELGGDTVDDFRLLNTGELVPHLVEAVQHLQAKTEMENRELRAENAALRARLDKLERAVLTFGDRKVANETPLVR